VAIPKIEDNVPHATPADTHHLPAAFYLLQLIIIKPSM
jgi:hypothetical protein